jgi:hypothetical protein
MCLDAGYYRMFGYGTTLSGSVGIPAAGLYGGMKLRHMIITRPAFGVSLQDEIQTLNNVSRAIHRYYSVLLCYCGTTAEQLLILIFGLLAPKNGKILLLSLLYLALRM